MRRVLGRPTLLQQGHAADMKMLSLGIDTSTKTGYLALVRDSRLLLEETIDAELNHSANLLTKLQSALGKTGLSRCDLDCVGVGVGPGSLTGVRVAIAFARGLVLAIRRPLVGVCSLQGIAYRRKDHPGTVSVIVDARMGGFYHAAYRWIAGEIREVSPLSIVNRDELPRKLISGSVIVSPDTDAITAVLASCLATGFRIEPSPVFPSAEYIARRAIIEVTAGTFDPKKMLEPIYLRPAVFEAKSPIPDAPQKSG